MSAVPIETFRKLIGIDPWHFWGFEHPTLAPRRGSCDDIFFDEPWQGINVGRNEIRRWLDMAEDRIQQEIGYPIAPTYLEERVLWPGRWGPGAWINPGQWDRRWMSVQLTQAKVIAAGAEQHTLLGSPAVNLVDANGDGLYDYFQIQVATTETDPKNIAVYYPAAERTFGDTIGQRWRVEPVAMTFAGGVATIRGSAYLAGRPSLTAYYTATRTALDPTLAANYCTTFEVYKHTTEVDGTTETTSQAALYWLSEPLCDCVTTSVSVESDPAAVGFLIARVSLSMPDIGRVGVGAATFNTTSGTWGASDWTLSCRPPDYAIVRYLAGDTFATNGEVKPFWQQVIARYAAAIMPRQICACDTANKSLFTWQRDMARTDSTTEGTFTQISAEDLANPLGTQYGAMAAWRDIRNLIFTQGVHA